MKHSIKSLFSIFIFLTSIGFSTNATAAFKADFEADKTTVEVGQQVQFTDTSTGRHDWWEWQFEGGTPSYSEQINPTITYNTPGSYSVTLTVWRGYWRNRTKTKTNYITVVEAGGGNVAPTASFSFSCTDLACSFNGSASSDIDGSIASYNWNFGDGNSAINATASNTYAAAGNYTATLIVTDDQGATNSVSQTVSVTETVPDNVAPTASFSYNCTDLACSFDGSSSSDSDGNITLYSWTFGDGNSATNATASNTYSASGSYTVTLTVTDNDGATNNSSQTLTVTDNTPPPSNAKRIPAEWEVQEAVWIQWPGRWEKTYETAYGQMSKVISQYQKLHILTDSTRIRNEARSAISAAGGNPDHANISWHSIGNDNAWMRDNGPIYVAENSAIRLQNWEFDAWGGGFDTQGATVAYGKDNLVPNAVGSYLGMSVEQINIVQERGNLEFNGKDTLILNWSVIGDPNRNAGYSKAQATADMKQYFGVTKVVWIEGYQANDLTRGHIDGIARFIDQGTVVVGQCLQGSLCYDNATEKAIYDNAAAEIAAAGFTVIREPFNKSTNYNGGNAFDIDYMNWLVGNGFVIAVGFEDAAQNAAAAARLQTYYPNRQIYVIDMLASWDAGGGAHCHTNDQPADVTAAGYTPWVP